MREREREKVVVSSSRSGSKYCDLGLVVGAVRVRSGA